MDTRGAYTDAKSSNKPLNYRTYWRTITLVSRDQFPERASGLKRYSMNEKKVNTKKSESNLTNACFGARDQRLDTRRANTARCDDECIFRSYQILMVFVAICC